MKQIFFCLVFLAFVTFLFSTIWPTYTANESMSHNNVNPFESLKAKYPNQTVLFWANMQSTYRHSILKSKDPSIILMVSDETTRQDF